MRRRRWLSSKGCTGVRTRYLNISSPLMAVLLAALVVGSIAAETELQVEGNGEATGNETEEDEDTGPKTADELGYSIMTHLVQ